MLYNALWSIYQGMLRSCLKEDTVVNVPVCVCVCGVQQGMLRSCLKEDTVVNVSVCVCVVYNRAC